MIVYGIDWDMDIGDEVGELLAEWPVFFNSEKCWRLIPMSVLASKPGFFDNYS